jgi:ketosteroid isomerase-like protein
MSQENVEIARSYYELLGRALDAYWDDPEVTFAELPLVSDVLDHHVHPEVRWKSVFAPDTTFTGREELLQAVDTWLQFADDWRVKVEDLVDAGGDRVFAAVRVSMRGKGSRVAVDQVLYTVLKIREGKIGDFHDHVDRQEALEAAGLPE